MSCVELSTPIPNVKKGFGVHWFRVPQESIAAAKAEYEAWRAAYDERGTARPKLCGIIPLVVFGPKTMRRIYEPVMRTTGTIPPIEDWIWLDGGPTGSVLDCSAAAWYNGVSVFGEGLIFHNYPSQPNTAVNYVFTGALSNDFDPSYIGIDCTGDIAQLSINLVMPAGNTASFVGSAPVEAKYETTASGHIRQGEGTCPGAPTYSVNEAGQLCMNIVTNDGVYDVQTTYTYESNASVQLGCRPETFRTLPLRRTGDGLGGSNPDTPDRARENYVGQEVSAEHWHCLAFSFDLSHPVTTEGVQIEGLTDDLIPTVGLRTSSACRLFVNFDGVNLTGSRLSAYWPNGSSDPNAIVTVNGFFVACDNLPTVTQGPTPNCNGETVTLTTINMKPAYSYRPTFLPMNGGSMGFPANVDHVDGVRHVEMGEFQFFTETVADTGDATLMGKIITDKGKPAPMSLLAEYLGKEPEVKLHGRSNWKAGRNTGTLARTTPEDGIVIGRVESYSPNPNLYGPQGT